MRFHLWERFSDYDNSVGESTFAKLIEDNFASLSMEGPTTNFELVKRIADVSNLCIPVESLSSERPTMSSGPKSAPYRNGLRLSSIAMLAGLASR